MYVCFYVYKLVIVYLGVSFTHANEWNTSCQSLMMKDNSLKVKVCLFGQNAGSNFSIGDVLQVLAEQHAVDKFNKYQMRGKKQN